MLSASTSLGFKFNARAAAVPAAERHEGPTFTSRLSGRRQSFRRSASKDSILPIAERKTAGGTCTVPLGVCTEPAEESFPEMTGVPKVLTREHSSSTNETSQ